jgi:hypothetical protein
MLEVLINDKGGQIFAVAFTMEVRLMPSVASNVGIRFFAPLPPLNATTLIIYLIIGLLYFTNSGEIR